MVIKIIKSDRGNKMKKYLFIIIVSLFITLGLTGCYTELLTTNATLASDNPDNTTVIYYPVPVADPVPFHPHPVYPQPVYSPKTPPNNPGNNGDTKRSETTVRDDNGGRGSTPRNEPSTTSRTRIEPVNTGTTGSANNSNISGSSNGNRIESANSGNNSSSRAGNTNNNTARNNNGSRNTSGGR